MGFEIGLVNLWTIELYCAKLFINRDKHAHTRKEPEMTNLREKMIETIKVNLRKNKLKVLADASETEVMLEYIRDTYKRVMVWRDKSKVTVSFLLDNDIDIEMTWYCMALTSKGLAFIFDPSLPHEFCRFDACSYHNFTTRGKGKKNRRDEIYQEMGEVLGLLFDFDGKEYLNYYEQ